MKRSLQFFFFFLFITQICFAQWFQQNSGTTKNLNAVTFTDANNGFAVGDSGIILHTNDGGSTWAEQTSGTNLKLFDICFTDSNNGWAVGGHLDEYEVGADSSVILHTTDGGISWLTEIGGIGYGCFYDCCFTDANAGTIVGCYKDSIGGWFGMPLVLRTNDGGLSWSQQTYSDPNFPLRIWPAVHFIDENTGWLTEEVGSMWSGSRIRKTTDGGISWQVQLDERFGLASRLCRIKFNNENTGFAVGGFATAYPKARDQRKINRVRYGGEGLILFSTDGGSNWINADTSWYWPNPFNDVFLTGTNLAIAVGDSGTILQATCAVGGLIEQTSNTDSCLNGVYFVDDLIGWVVGDGGTILHTTNGGNPVPVELKSFSATANNKEITLNWSTATELNNQGFEVQRKFGSNDFVTVGSVKGNGTTTSPNQYTYVEKLTDAGKYFYRLKQIDFGGKYEYSQTAEVNWSPFTTYQLEQNYPNPFNPTTTIGFGIPEKGNVRLSVLNILGEEIKILLNEGKEAGYHSADFNASELPSGVYFYKLTAGNFISTRKMLLLK